MKKLVFILMAFFFVSQYSYAQAPAGKPQIKKTTVAKTDSKKAPKTKKDGTPDMRYKANKQAAPKSTPTPKQK